MYHFSLHKLSVKKLLRKIALVVVHVKVMTVWKQQLCQQLQPQRYKRLLHRLFQMQFWS